MSSMIEKPTTSPIELDRSMSSRDARVLVVMYHYVHDRPAGGGDSAGAFDGVRGLTLEQFRAQIGRLCSRLEPIEWQKLNAWRGGRAALPRDGFLLTFDDGLADHVQHVAPILEGYGLRGTFFVSGEALAVRRMFAAHMIHLLLSRIGDDGLEAVLRARLNAEESEEDWCASLDKLLGDQTGAAAVYHYESPRRAALKYWLTMVLPIGLRTRLLRALFAQHVGPEAEWSGRWYMDWDDLAALHWKGHTVGGHGFCHEPYARLSAFEQRADVARISAILSDNLGEMERPFSYPFGSCGAESHALFGGSPFVQAFSTERNWMSHGAALYSLPRVDTIYVDAFLESSVLCEAV